MLKRFAIVSLLLAVIGGAVFATAYRSRATILLPMSDVARMEWLDGYVGLDCTGFLTVAHGDASYLPSGAEWYRDAEPVSFNVVSVYESRADVDESKLEPGDIAAFTGPDGLGKHVAGFVRPGKWIDSDVRRGGVASYDLRTKPQSDDWFTGKVRILRWKKAGPRSPISGSTAFSLLIASSSTVSLLYYIRALIGSLRFS